LGGKKKNGRKTKKGKRVGNIPSEVPADSGLQKGNGKVHQVGF